MSFFRLGFVAVLFASGLLGNSSFAIDIESSFDAANKLYEQGKFEAAASAYEKALPAGEVSSALLYNLGNARFKAGEVGKANAAYQEAERLAPRDLDLRANLQFVRNQIQGPSLQPGRFQLWVGKLTVNEWTALTGAAFWFTLMLLTLMQLRPGGRQSLRTFTLISGLVTVGLGVCLVAVLADDSARMAIVTAKSAPIRNGPLDESPVALTVHDGAELKVLDAKDGWLQVSVGNRIGWLKREQTVVQRMGKP